MIDLLVVSAFGGIGCALRAMVRDAMRQRGHAPAATICAINLLGSAVMGMVMAASRMHGAAPTHAVTAAAGLLAGWTTFSAFSMDVVQLWWRGDRGRALLIWVATLVGSPALAWVGACTVRAVLGGEP
ncbi:MAG: fluoride efflux transporter CrcB [Planctomycetota bacterium]|jgi:CrcB protein